MIQTTATSSTNAPKLPVGISAWPDAVLHSLLQKILYHLINVMELQWDSYKKSTASTDPDTHLEKIQQLRILHYSTIMRLAELGLAASQPQVPGTPDFLQQTLTLSLNLRTALRQLRTDQIALLEEAGREDEHCDADDAASRGRYDLETLEEYLTYIEEQLPGLSLTSPSLETPSRIEAGYGVAAVYDPHGPIRTFPDSADGRDQAIQLAKSLCRDRSQRGCLYDSDRVTDPNFITTVERFYTQVEVLGLFSPQDDPDSIRFGHLPGKDNEQGTTGVLRTKGQWCCLEFPEDPSIASDSKELMLRIEPLVQALEIAVCTAATRITMCQITGDLVIHGDFDAIFQRLYEAAQYRGAVDSPDGFIRSLLTLPEVDAQFADSIANQLYAAQQQVSEAVADAASALLAQLPEQHRDQATGDLRAFIYEILLAAVCSE